MKRFLFFILLTSLFLCSCKFSFAENDTVSSEKTNEVSQSSSVADNPAGKNKVYITLNKSSARTALPTIDWADDTVPFSFKLTAIENPNESTQKLPVVVFENRTYLELSAGFELECGKYKFILDAYRSGVKSLSGEVIFDLSMGDSTLSFLMLPVSGSTGSATIEITFPFDETVGSVKAAVCSDIFISPDSITTEDVTGSVKVVSGKKILTYSKTGLPSNTQTFAHFWFYDAAGSLIYSGLESIIVVGGCVSHSELVLTSDDWHTYLCTVTLKKDDAGWAFSEKTVSLVDKSNSSRVYNFSERTGGTFTASVAEGLYNIYVNNENTEEEFNSVNETAVVDYYSVSMTPVKCCTMVPVSGGIYMADNSAIVQKDKDFVYKVNLSQGYEVSGTLEILQNGVALENPVFGTDITIPAISEKQTVLVNGLGAITYSITYKDEDQATINEYYEGIKTTSLPYWYDDNKTYTPPVSFTADDIVTLPAFQNIRKNSSFFDAWLSGSDVIKTTENIFHDIVVTASWKSIPFADESSKTLYANGFNLLITGDTLTTNNKTYICIDYNGDGIKNYDDQYITEDGLSDDESEAKDFTGYSLSAANYDDSKKVNSDFTFTMTGGIISSIYGLKNQGEKNPVNKSTLNISGTAVIGSITDKTTTQINENSKVTTAKKVTGIMLDTLSDERVNITGKMSSYRDSEGKEQQYSVTCVSSFSYDENEDHVIAYIANSNYATFNYFTCWTKLNLEPGSTEDPYKNCLLAQKYVIENGREKTLISLSDDSGIIMPKTEEIEGELIDEFKFNGEIVTKACSVFSLSVEKGTFRLNERLSVTKKQTDTENLIENTLSYMAQPDPFSYVKNEGENTNLSFDEKYIYFQVISEGNKLTPEMVSDFLSQIYFKRDDPEAPMKISINLETVRSSDINDAGVNYFNGSFYKNVSNGSKNIHWDDSYNLAKESVFNGLQGYLMNPTSLVENNYIFSVSSTVTLRWIGGSLFEPLETISDENGNEVPRYDQSVYPNVNSNGKTDTSVANPTFNQKGSGVKPTSTWKWQAGPEAGMVYYAYPAGDYSTKNTAAQNEIYKQGFLDGVVVEDGTQVFHRWNNVLLFPDEWEKSLRGRQGYEPNSPVTDSDGNVTSQGQCMQFLAGNVSNFIADGYWNNDSVHSNNSTYGSKGYIIEYTPYETIYSSQIAGSPAIKRTAIY